MSITDYRTKRVILQAEAKTPAVLLFNERINPDWKLWVDNKPAPILRCNYIMRGVFLTPGSHTVDFRFEPSLKTLYVSLLAIAFGIGLAGYLFATRSPATAAPAGTEPLPSQNPLPPLPHRLQSKPPSRRLRQITAAASKREKEPKQPKAVLDESHSLGHILLRPEN